MTTPDYFHVFENYQSLDVSKLAEHLNASKKKVIGEVTLAELCSFTERPNGLYFFYDMHDVLLYVGKAASRSFIERIPAHFDIRPDAWFNTLPKRVMSVRTIAEYPAAHALALTFRLVLLGMKSQQSAMKLEAALRDYMQPELNKSKIRKIDGNELLSRYAS